MTARVSAAVGMARRHEAEEGATDRVYLFVGVEEGGIVGGVLDVGQRPHEAVVVGFENEACSRAIAGA